MHHVAGILPPSRPMKAMSGVLESYHRALSIGRIIRGDSFYNSHHDRKQLELRSVFKRPKTPDIISTELLTKHINGRKNVPPVLCDFKMWFRTVDLTEYYRAHRYDREVLAPDSHKKRHCCKTEQLARA